MDLDKVYDRKDTKAVKLEYLKTLFKTDDVLPLWVADMDFEVSEEIRESISQRLKHPIFGYTIQGEDFYKSITSWLSRKHNWEVSERNILFTPSVLPSIALIIRKLTEKGDKIMIQPPVYHPFFSLIESSERTLVTNPLKESGNEYVIDFEDMENSFKENVKLIIIANPHNPVGKVWTMEELNKLVDLCSKYDVKIVSDEIHSDLIFGDKPHIPIASISKEASEITMTCMSPTKSFNIAGLTISYIVVENRRLRATLKKEIESYHLNNGNTFGIAALIAAYDKSEVWLNAVIEYIRENLKFASEYISENIPQLKTFKNEGTYMLWIDFRSLGLSNIQLKEFLVKEAKLGLNQGVDFGQGGEGFARMNVATQRSVVEKALVQLKKAVESI